MSNVNLPEYSTMRFFAACLTIAAAAPLAALRAQTVPDTTSLSPVIVTATRSAVPTSISTAATTVITGSELRARGAVTLVDALRTVPGIALGQTAGPGSQASVFLRGGNSNYTKVLVDGVPVNAPGGALDISTLTTDNIDRIEVLRGPASVQYGSDAMTGVIQIFTRREPGTNVAASAGNRDGQYEVVAGTAHSTQLGGSTRLRGALGGGLHHGNGFLPFNNEFRNSTANALVGAAGARGDVTASATFGDSRYHYPTTGGGTPVDSNAYTGATRVTFATSGSWHATDRLAAHAQLGRADTHSISDDRRDSPADTLGFYSRSHGRAIRNTADLQLVATRPATVVTTLGGAIEGQRMESRGWSQFQSFDPSVTTFSATRTNRAVYAQVNAGRASLAADAGGRRERLSNGCFANTGRVGLASELVPGVVLRASLGTAFKEPALDEMFDGPFSIGAKDLRPERSRSREVGAESRLPGGRVALGATLFDQRFADLIQYRLVDHSVDPTTPDYYNVVAARSRGLEIEGRAMPLTALTLHGSYSFLHTEVTNEGNGGFGAVANGKPLLRRPRRSAAVDAVYRGHFATAGVTASRVGARDDYSFDTPGGRVRLDPYTLVGAAIELPLALRERGWTVALTARGENLGNASYQNVYGFRTPGRVVFVGARLHD
ncbi:MAG: TonB-dependent receptor plug domain-containing protein [Gemmatimonadaceae bacterium]